MTLEVSNTSGARLVAVALDETRGRLVDELHAVVSAEIDANESYSGQGNEC